MDRDVLAQPGVQYLVVELGTNDIGLPNTRVSSPSEAVTVDDLIAGYRQIIARGHERGMEAFGATITPVGGSGYYPEGGEAVRQAVNAWIRNSGELDGVVDFDRARRAALCAPTTPSSRRGS